MKKLLIPISYILSHPLTKRNPLPSILRFVKWQLRSLFIKKPFVFNWLGDVKLKVVKGMHGATGCLYVGLPEFPDMSFLLHFLNERDLFIDVGANVGVYSVLASGNNKSHTISIEPLPKTYESLQSNIQLNNLHQLVKTKNVGIGAVKGSLSFTANLDTTNHVVQSGIDNALEVPVETLDHISISVDKFENILLKIDVEGFELNVLKGGYDLLSRKSVKAIIIELNGSGLRYGFSDKAVDEYLGKLGFAPFVYDPTKRLLHEMTTFNSQENTLYVKKSSLDDVKDKLTNAKSFKIFDKVF